MRKFGTYVSLNLNDVDDEKLTGACEYNEVNQVQLDKIYKINISKTRICIKQNPDGV